MPTLAYCATLNEYTPDDVATLKNGRDEVGYLIAGHEVASTGKGHLQIYFQLTKQVKFSTIKNWDVYKRMHLEPAKAETGPNELEKQGVFGEPYTANGYCMKDGNYWEIGTCRKMGKKGSRTDLDNVKSAIDKGMDYDTLCDSQFGTVARFSKFINERIQARDSKTAKDLLLKELESLSLKPWQEDLVGAVTQPPHPRKIHWIWSQAGETGKSTMATYLGVKYGATVLELCKNHDLKHILAKGISSIVIFDLTRTTEDCLKGLYSLAEQLKNGRITSGKYDGSVVYFPKPHVVFFANFPPDMKAWSADRYLIWEIA